MCRNCCQLLNSQKWPDFTSVFKWADWFVGCLLDVICFIVQNAVIRIGRIISPTIVIANLIHHPFKEFI
ncbi:hypothetical protein HanPSC8_Chr03g0087681 [Helianthus annuus]|nr:hypothetical protein HanPSC8_Chr03g0087681 [Helianthus annuus]